MKLNDYKVGKRRNKHHLLPKIEENVTIKVGIKQINKLINTIKQN